MTNSEGRIQANPAIVLEAGAVTADDDPIAIGDTTMILFPGPVPSGPVHARGGT